MSPQKGPRRHFTHQQISPCFVSSTYEKQWGGKFENKILNFISKIKNKLRAQ